jgi:lipopolysaccharide export system protein LptA
MSLAFASLGWGQEGVNKTVITSDRLTFDYKKSAAVFEGNVVAIDPRMKIESDELRVLFNKTNEVRSVTAIGNVHMKSEDKTATCNKAVYLSETEEVVLTGNARLNRGRDTVTGDRITFYLDEDRVVVEGGTQLTIFPDQNPTNRFKLPKR